LARKPAYTSILLLDHPVASWLRIASEGGRTEAVSFGQLAGLSGTDAEDIAKLSAFAKEHGIGGDRLSSVLPRHQLTTRILTLPSQDKAEIASMVALSAEEFVPFSSHEIIVDQVLLHKLPSGESRVLVAIAHKDVVHRHVAQLQAAGLEPEHVYLSTTCLAAGVVASASASAATRFALVHLSAGGLEVLVFNEGRLEFCRGVASTTNWSATESRDQAVEELAIEVRGSLATHRRESEDGESVDLVYLCSDFADPAPYVDPLFTETGKEVAVAPFLGNLIAGGKEHVRDVLPLACAGAARTALQGSGVAIDLVPADLTRGRKEAYLRARALKVVAAAAAVLLCLGLLYGQLRMQRNAYIGELHGQVGAIEDRARGIEEKERQLRILREQVERTGSLLEILATAADAAPETGLNLTKISFGRADGLDLWGLARTRDDVASYAQTLRDRGGQTLEFFRHARSLYETQGMERGEQVFHFHVTVPMLATDDEGELNGRTF